MVTTADHSRYSIDSGNALTVPTAVPKRNPPKTRLRPARPLTLNRCPAIRKSASFFLFSPKSGYSLNLTGRVCAVTNVSARTGVPRSDLAVRLPSCSANAIRSVAELKLVRRAWLGSRAWPGSGRARGCRATVHAQRPSDRPQRRS